MSDDFHLWERLKHTQPKTRQRAKAAIAILDNIQGCDVYRPTEIEALRGLDSFGSKRWTHNINTIISMLEVDGTIKLEYDTSLLLAFALLDGLGIHNISPNTVEIRQYYIVLKGAREIANYLSTLDGVSVTASQVERAQNIIAERQNDKKSNNTRRRIY